MYNWNTCFQNAKHALNSIILVIVTIQKSSLQSFCTTIHWAINCLYSSRGQVPSLEIEDFVWATRTYMFKMLQLRKVSEYAEVGVKWSYINFECSSGRRRKIDELNGYFSYCLTFSIVWISSTAELLTKNNHIYYLFFQVRGETGLWSRHVSPYLRKELK